MRCTKDQGLALLLHLQYCWDFLADQYSDTLGSCPDNASGLGSFPDSSSFWSCSYGTLSCFIYLMSVVSVCQYFAGASRGPDDSRTHGRIPVSFHGNARGGSICRLLQRAEGYMFRVAAGFAVSLFIIYTLGTVWLIDTPSVVGGSAALGHDTVCRV